MDKDTILDYVTETPGNTNRAVLRSMLNSIGGDSSLPEVTEDDNGKVLTVVEGTWNKAETSGGGVFYVNVLTNEGVISLDKTWKEIHDALTVNKQAVFLIEDVDGYYTVSPLSAIYVDASVYYIEIYGGNTSYTADNENGYPIYAD